MYKGLMMIKDAAVDQNFSRDLLMLPLMHNIYTLKHKNVYIKTYNICYNCYMFTGNNFNVLMYICCAYIHCAYSQCEDR
jgi:hypothetical protein